MLFIGLCRIRASRVVYSFELSVVLLDRNILNDYVWESVRIVILCFNVFVFLFDLSASHW